MLDLVEMAEGKTDLVRGTMGSLDLVEDMIDLEVCHSCSLGSSQVQCQRLRTQPRGRKCTENTSHINTHFCLLSFQI